MPKKIPISFNSAIQLIVDKKRLAFEAGQVGRKPGHYLWYIENFVSCISSMGYHIELTGDEFETYNLTEHLS